MQLYESLSNRSADVEILLSLLDIHHLVPQPCQNATDDTSAKVQAYYIIANRQQQRQTQKTSVVHTTRLWRLAPPSPTYFLIIILIRLFIFFLVNWFSR